MNRVAELGGGSLRQCGPLWGSSCLAGCSADLLGHAAPSAGEAKGVGGEAQSCEQAALAGDRDRDRMRNPVSPAVVAEQLARASSLNGRGGGGGGGGGALGGAGASADLDSDPQVRLRPDARTFRPQAEREL